MSETLILRNDSLRKIEWTVEANNLKEAALSESALIGKVTNPDENQAAVLAQTTITTLIRNVEAARKQAKEPIIVFSREIDRTAEVFVEELKREQLRIAKMMGDFAQLEQKRLMAAQQAENERLTKLERERAAEVAKATTHEQVESIAEVFDARVRLEAPAVAPIAKGPGQSNRQDWDITILDIHTLYAAHRQCVQLTPRMAEIKSLIKAGIKVNGVAATPKTVVVVLSAKPTPAIDV